LVNLSLTGGAVTLPTLLLLTLPIKKSTVNHNGLGQMVWLFNRSSN